MPFCVFCGKPLEEDAVFCEYCGAKQTPDVQPLPGEPAAVLSQGAVTPPPAGEGGYGSVCAPSAPRKPLPKGAKIALIAAAAVVVLLVGLHLVLGAIFTPQKTVNSFVDAIRAKDGNTLRSVATLYSPAGEEAGELSDELLAPFFAYYSKNNGALDSYMHVLEEDMDNLERGKTSTGNGFLRLVEKKHLLYATYQVEMTLQTFQVSSEFDGTQATIAGESFEVGSDAPYRLDLLPGVYSAQATYTSPETGITLNSTVDETPLTSNGDSIYFSFDYSSLWVGASDSSYEITALSINGVPYQGDLTKFSTGCELYPIAAGSKLEATIKVGDLDFTAAYDMAEDGYGSFYISPSFSQDQLKAAMDAAAEYAGKVWKARRTNDAVALHDLAESDASESVAGWAKDADSYAERYGEGGEYYADRRVSTFQGTGIVCDSAPYSTSFVPDDVTCTIRLSVTGQYAYTDYEDGEVYRAYDPDEETQGFRVTLRLSGSDWTITRISTTYAGSFSEPYEVEFPA